MDNYKDFLLHMMPTVAPAMYAHLSSLTQAQRLELYRVVSIDSIDAFEVATHMTNEYCKYLWEMYNGAV